jgi:hypothetical protein
MKAVYLEMHAAIEFKCIETSILNSKYKYY